MKVVYIAGPYRDARGEYYVNQNINRAREYALDVWSIGGVALCPHMNTALFGGANNLDDQVWLDGCLELVRRCDAVYVINDSDDSEGTQQEIDLAIALELPVLRNYGALCDYLEDDQVD